MSDVQKTAATPCALVTPESARDIIAASFVGENVRSAENARALAEIAISDLRRHGYSIIRDGLPAGPQKSGGAA